MAIPIAREHFQLTVDAPFLTVGDHTALTTNASTGDFITKPSSAPGNIEATHIMIQAISENVRLRLDGGQASGATGFLLTAAAAAVILPVPNDGVSVFPAAAGAIVQYQWLG